MKIILIRHGDAGAYTLPDHERNLSELGRAQANQTATWLYDSGYITAVSQFVSSPYNRAVQTLQVLLDKIDKPFAAQICKHITPDDDARVGLQSLAALLDDEIITQEGCLVVVCHMNIVAKLASLLTGEHESGFALAEARVYELPFVQAGQAKRIDGFVPT